jgi:Phage integrase family
LEKFRDEHGQKSLKAMLDDQRHSEKWLRKLLDTLSSSNVKRTWLVALRHFLAWCNDQDLIRHDPSLGIKVKTRKSDGHWSWTPEEVAQYEAYHPVDSMARKALALGKYAMVRREDASLLGPQHISRGDTVTVGQLVIDQWLNFQPKKTKHSSGTKVSTPVFPELTRILKATPSGHLTFLVRPNGKPYSANELGIQFGRWCDEAGLPKRCRFHGLRKYGAVNLAERGAHPLEVAAWGGWETLTEVLRYIKAAERKKLAANALRRVLTADAEQAVLVVEENKAGA